MEDNVKSEISQMLSALEGSPLEEESEELKEEPKEEEKEEPKEDEEEEPEEESKEEPKGEKEEEQKPNEKDLEIEALKAENERLKAEQKKGKEEEEKEEKFEEQDFIGDVDLDDLFHDKAELNKLLNSVYSKGVKDARKLTSERVLLSIPDIVKHNIDLQTSLREASEQFYADNQDLKPFRKVVATVFEEVASKNPGKKLGEVMKIVAQEARKSLDLHKEAKGKEKPGVPKLPNKKSGTGELKSKPSTSSVQDEINQMNQVLGR